MNKEIGNIEMNNTWELLKLPKEKHTIEVKWICKLNNDIN